MALTIYRKYRPQTFEELVGQNHIKTTLQSELETSKIAHAYLFSGPRGLGKTTTARLLAKAVNCLRRQADQSEPCNDCEACREVIEGKSLDIIEIDAASHTGVDNVRENIINNSRFTPTSRKYKVFIIDEVHMLSVSAFNALLKTLEEPPAHAIFILATTEIHKVPQTIISRCQHFEFRKINNGELLKRLNHIVGQENKKIDQSILENIAYHSQGCLRDAESLLGQVLSLSDKEITVEQAELVLPQSQYGSVISLLKFLDRNDLASALMLINELVEDGVNLEKFVSDTIEVLRKILLVKVNSSLSNYGGALNKDLEKDIFDFSQSLNLDFLVRSIEVLIGKRQEMKYAEIVQLPLELAVVEIIGVKDHDSKKESNSDDDQINFSSSGPGAATKAKSPLQPLVEKKSKVVKSVINKVEIDLEQVVNRWAEILHAIKQVNHSLASTLKIGRPAQLQDNVLEISFGHKFHQQRINDSKNREILEKIFEEVIGSRLIINTTVNKDTKELPIKIDGNNRPELPASPGIDNIIEAFGGQLVD
ncbi:MAG: DNA polymerase III subunit gamma/tau [Patescibacteria group bacterium]|jgi:DNA polymerase-3 subunit gamma/tau|nr:DNA polymerase III subunit gamma/tau [Patescibacteria group bacterium]